MISFLSRLEKKYTDKIISINWMIVCVFAFFWTYGIYGFFTVPLYGIGVNMGITACLTAIFIYLIYVHKKAIFTDTVTISFKDIIFTIAYLVVLLCILFRDLILPIDQDQLYHAQQAVMPSTLVVKALSSVFPSLSTFSFSFLILLSNIVIICSLFIAYRVGKVWKLKGVYVVFLLTILFVAMRYAVFIFGGNTSAFPTFRLFPIWATGTLFLYSDFAFRVATFFGLLFIMVFASKFARKYMSDRLSFVLGLCIGTIPVLLHVGTIVESSLWASLAWVLTVLYVNAWSEGESVPYVRIISVIVLCTLMRVSSFVTLVPIFMMLAYDVWNKKIKVKESALITSLCLLFVPVIIMSIVVGSPATYRGDASLFPVIKAHANILERLYILITSGSFVTYTYNSVRGVLIILLLVLPFLIITNIKKVVLVFTLFLSGFVIFYSINPDLWGNGRYQSEYIIPFVVLSIFLISRLFKKYEVTVTLLLCMGIIYNVYLFTLIPKLNIASVGQDSYFKAMKVRGEYFVLSDFPYEYKVALMTAKQDGFATSTLYVNGYSYFAAIMSGYTLSEMKSIKKYNDAIGLTISSSTAEKINTTKDIQIVLFNGSKKNANASQEKLGAELRALGWAEWKTFTNTRFGNVLYGLQRKVK